MPIELVSPVREYAEVRDACERAVCEVLASGKYILGEQVGAFERAFADYVGTEHAVGVANGTDALCIALRSLGIGDGDEVITTPYTFFATAEAIAAVGATPVFCDVREDTYNIDAQKILPLITERTKAILPVHIFGQCADMDAINMIAKRSGLYVIEDACQAAGAWYKGRMAGGLSDVACFSFFPTKNLACAGDGGMITTDYNCIAEVSRGLRAHGGGIQGKRAAELLCNDGQKPLPSRQRDAIRAEGPDEEMVQSKYHNHLIGYNSRLDEIQAAILRVKLNKLDSFMERRREIAAFYGHTLRECKGITLPFAGNPSAHAWHMYVLRSSERDALRAHLDKKGIVTGVYYPVPLHLQPAFAQLGYREGDMPVAEALSRSAVAIPLFAQMTELERWYVADSVKEFCQ